VVKVVVVRDVDMVRVMAVMYLSENVVIDA
jgi:hypothetical protein